MTDIKDLLISETKPLTLKQLKTIYDEPVWVKVLNHEMFADPDDDFDGWGMVRQSWVRLWDAKRADLISVKYDFEDYGKTWVAYSYRMLVEVLLKKIEKGKNEKKKLYEADPEEISNMPVQAINEPVLIETLM